MSSDNRRALLHEVAAGSAPDSEKGVSTNAIIYLLRVLVLLRVQLLLLLSDAMPLLLSLVFELLVLFVILQGNE